MGAVEATGDTLRSAMPSVDGDPEADGDGIAAELAESSGAVSFAVSLCISKSSSNLYRPSPVGVDLEGVATLPGTRLVRISRATDRQ